MPVTIRRKNRHVSQKEQRYIVFWLLEELFGHRLAANIHVNIKNYIPKKKDPDPRFITLGLTDPEDEGPSPREFSLYLNPISKRGEHVYTIAHECGHVWQYAKNMLREHSLTLCSFGNRTYVVSEDNETMKQYRSTPWETEAEQIGLKLSKKYFAHKRKNKLDFS